MSEPRTIEEMRERYRAARGRMDAAGQAQAARPADQGSSAPSEAPAARAEEALAVSQETVPPAALDDDAFDPTTMPPVRAIIRRFAEERGLAWQALVGESRALAVVRARHEAVAQVHRLRPDLSTTQIGRAFRRDHTSVIYALRRARGLSPDEAAPSRARRLARLRSPAEVEPGR